MIYDIDDSDNFEDKDRYDEDEDEANDEQKKSSFLGIMFECCNIYGRIYKNKEGTAYVGRCPRCMRNIRIKVGEGGTGARFFRAQ